MPTVIAVRHAETDWTRTGRLQGWAPTDLNERGREQAASAGAWLADEYDVDRAVGSDLLGARRTADLVTRARGRRAGRPRRRLRERHLGVYHGLTYAKDEERVSGRRPATGWLQVLVE